MFEQEINASIKFLDSHFPGWYKDIDLNILNMQYPDYCVLGQVMKIHNLGQDWMVKVGLTIDYQETVPCFKPEYGFATGTEPNKRGEWDKLTEEWQDKINELRNA